MQSRDALIERFRAKADMQVNVPRHLEARLPKIKALVVDDDHYMRKVVRTMLMAIGVRNIFEASNGAAGLESIKANNPDIVVVDWEMPGIDGLQFTRMVRSPDTFPFPDVPIILLTGHADRWRVLEAARFGIHEYLLKPVSTKALLERIVAVLTHPRQMINIDGYYGPAPRKTVVLDDPRAADSPDDDILLLR